MPSFHIRLAAARNLEPGKLYPQSAAAARQIQRPPSPPNPPSLGGRAICALLIFLLRSVSLRVVANQSRTIFRAHGHHCTIPAVDAASSQQPAGGKREGGHTVQSILTKP